MTDNIERISDAQIGRCKWCGSMTLAAPAEEGIVCRGCETMRSDREFPTFSRGDTIRIEGLSYEVTDIVYSHGPNYRLDRGSSDRIWLNTNYEEGRFVLVTYHDVSLSDAFLECDGDV